MRTGPALLALALLVAAVPVAGQEPERAAGAHDRAAPEEGEGEARHDEDAVEGAVRETVAAFKEALRAADSATALALLHPDVRIYEGGVAETKEEYRSGHLGADMAFLGAVSSETTWDEVVNGGGMALYTSRYRARGEFRGREVDSHGTETIVLVPTDGGWKIRHIHWSSR